jgi:hypothetical protein
MRISRKLSVLSCCVSHRAKVNAFGYMPLAVGALLGAHSLVRAQSSQETDETAQTTQVEEIYVVRSVR